MAKQVKLSTLKAKLWRLVSEYVRRKDANSDGLVECVTCGKWSHWKDVHAGHFLPKKKGSAVYFNMENIHPQCPYCNVWQRGNLHAYYDYMLREYGQHKIDWLKQISRHPLKITRVEYEKMISDMKERLAGL